MSSLDAGPSWQVTELSPTLTVSREVPCSRIVHATLLDESPNAESAWFAVAFLTRAVPHGASVRNRDLNSFTMHCATRAAAVELVHVLMHERGLHAPALAPAPAPTPSPARTAHSPPPRVAQQANDWPTGTTPMVMPEAEDTAPSWMTSGPLPNSQRAAAGVDGNPSTLVALAASADDADDEFRRLDSLAYNLIVTAEKLYPRPPAGLDMSAALSKLRVGCDRLRRGVDDALIGGGASTPGNERSVELWLSAVDAINETLENVRQREMQSNNSVNTDNAYLGEMASSADLARESAAAEAAAASAAGEDTEQQAAAAVDVDVAAAAAPPTLARETDVDDADGSAVQADECGVCFEAFSLNGDGRRALFFPCLHAKQCLSCAMSVWESASPTGDVTCPWCSVVLSAPPAAIWM